jgi:hypothetical protein
VISLSFDQAQSVVGQLVLDALLSEEISLEGEVTLYPIEDGSLITDHIFQGAEKVRISGVVSTDDIAAFSLSAGGKTRLVDAIDTLRSMHKERALITVSTGIQQYAEMGIASLKAVRSSDGRGGNFLEINAELVKIRKVKLKTAEVPEEKATRSAKGRAGQTNTPAGKSSSASTSAQSSGSASTPANSSVLHAATYGGQGFKAADQLLAKLRAGVGL